ncbi:hypothetical protein C8R45DRAFT_517019 [Mycena sanguinolenta]|nr:hypothetical protein C8R45DRAFT_517019 [Mycena sanguinolenta]
MGGRYRILCDCMIPSSSSTTTQAFRTDTTPTDDPSETPTSFHGGEIIRLLQQQGLWCEVIKGDESIGVVPSRFLILASESPEDFQFDKCDDTKRVEISEDSPSNKHPDSERGEIDQREHGDAPAVRVREGNWKKILRFGTTLLEWDKGKEKSKGGFWGRDDKSATRLQLTDDDDLAPTTLGILEALEPANQGQHVRNRSEEPVEQKSKELRGDKDRRDEESELTRKIGFLTATGSEDWTLVLDVCDQASATVDNAKQAVRTLRNKFKYGEPAAQLAATRLWAILLRNSTHTFIGQSTARKFLDTLEDVLTSSRTSPVVRERLLEVVSAAAYASGPDKDKGFRGLSSRVRPRDKPEEGAPFDSHGPMFNPFTISALSIASDNHAPLEEPLVV